MSASSNPLLISQFWSLVAPYTIPPVAASIAIIPAFYDMVAKTSLQKGLVPPSMSARQALKGGISAAPVVGVVVGTQMVLQSQIANTLAKMFSHLVTKDSDQAKGVLTLASSALVGALSSPFLAIYNGKTMTPPWSVQQSLSKFSFKQAGAISLQETGFVAGLAAADIVAMPMKQILGDNKAIDYAAAASAGALGSLFGHPGNTALTRWQAGMSIDNLQQLSLGALRKARGNALFAVIYKLGKEALNSTLEK